MTVTGKITIKFNKKLLSALENALSPEVESPSSDRTITEVAIEKNRLVITTTATDTTAFRASINSYLRWVQGIQEMVELLD